MGSVRKRDEGLTRVSGFPVIPVTRRGEHLRVRLWICKLRPQAGMAIIFVSLSRLDKIFNKGSST